MITITNYLFFKFTKRHSIYSSPVCPPDYVKKLQSPSLDFALWASVALRHCSKFAPGNFVTKGAAISSLTCMEAQISRAQDAQERCFPYASQANRTTRQLLPALLYRLRPCRRLHTVQLRIPG